MKRVIKKLVFTGFILSVTASVMAEEATGPILALLVGHPSAPMTLIVSVDDSSEPYATDCTDGLMMSDMSGDNAVDREDTQAYFSLLQTAKATAQDVVVYYHIDTSSSTYTENNCVIDAVAYAE